MKKTAFTLIELLVVISIVVLLMSVLLPTLQRVRNQAKAVACQAKLRQWGVAFRMYTDGNEGRWFTDDHDDDGRNGPQNWLGLTSPWWFNTPGFAACPAATRTWDGRRYDAFCHFWWKERGAIATTPSGEPILGPISYGFNVAVSWPPPQDSRSSVPPRDFYWGTCDVRGAASIPVFFDSMYLEARPSDYVGPPLGDAFPVEDFIRWPMCINRHDGGINMLFMDWSVRKVGLKELWTLKWHKLFNTSGLWTRQGGVLPEDWPQWMRRFKDY